MCGVQYKSPSACACACACACADGTALLGNGGPHVYAIAADPEWCSLAKELQLDGIPPLQYQLFAPVYSCIFLYIFLYIILYILSGGGGGVCVCVDLTRNRLALERHAHNLSMLRRKVFQDEMVLVRTPSPTLTLSHSTRWVRSLHERGGSIRLDSATRVLLGKARAGVAGIGSPAPATRPSAGR